VIADVSGKGITAALVMSSVATAFAIFTRTDPTPADLLRDINAILAPKTSPSKFVTMVAGVLDPNTGVVSFANAGHVPPLVISKDGVEALRSTDIVVGILPAAQYRNQTLTLGPGDSLILFTDGVTEAENIEEEQLGLDPVCEMLRTMHGSEARALLEMIDTHVHEYIGEVPHGDDVTMLAMSRGV
jgi:sigma-B regulation protein RsbU (phosphoserine phosphatase)